MEKYTKLREEFKPIVLTPGNGKELFFNGEMVQDENGQIIPEGEGFINISYVSKNHIARILSNMFPYEINFRGEKAASVEGILQGIKHQELDIQALVVKYSGLDAFHTRGATAVDDWRKRQTLTWKDEVMKRDSKEYQLFLDELYLAAFANSLYAKAIKSTKNKTLIHSIGCMDINETVLTRDEYESRLNSLKKF